MIISFLSQTYWWIGLKVEDILKIRRIDGGWRFLEPSLSYDLLLTYILLNWLFRFFDTMINRLRSPTPVKNLLHTQFNLELINRCKLIPLFLTVLSHKTHVLQSQSRQTTCFVFLWDLLYSFSSWLTYLYLIKSFSSLFSSLYSVDTSVTTVWVSARETR